MDLIKVLKECIKQENWHCAVSELISLLESYGFGEEAHRKQKLLQAELELIYKQHVNEMIQFLNQQNNMGQLDSKYESQLKEIIKAWYDRLIF